MPDVRRVPNTTWEMRIDFERINRQQDQRLQDTLRELRRLLRRIENQTLGWVVDNLARKKLRTAIVKFQLPLSAKYREIVRRRMLMAFRRGRSDVGKELDLRGRTTRSPARSRVRARADVLTTDHIERLETDLRRVWSQAMQSVVNREQLIYVTRLAFSNFAGWRKPEPP